MLLSLLWEIKLGNGSQWRILGFCNYRGGLLQNAWYRKTKNNPGFVVVFAINPNFAKFCKLDLQEAIVVMHDESFAQLETILEIHTHGINKFLHLLCNVI